MTRRNRAAIAAATAIDSAANQEHNRIISSIGREKRSLNSATLQRLLPMPQLEENCGLLSDNKKVKMLFLIDISSVKKLGSESTLETILRQQEINCSNGESNGKIEWTYRFFDAQCSNGCAPRELDTILGRPSMVTPHKSFYSFNVDALKMFKRGMDAKLEKYTAMDGTKKHELVLGSTAQSLYTIIQTSIAQAIDDLKWEDGDSLSVGTEKSEDTSPRNSIVLMAPAPRQLSELKCFFHKSYASAEFLNTSQRDYLPDDLEFLEKRVIEAMSFFDRYRGQCLAYLSWCDTEHNTAQNEESSIAFSALRRGLKEQGGSLFAYRLPYPWLHVSTLKQSKKSSHCQDMVVKAPEKSLEIFTDTKQIFTRGMSSIFTDYPKRCAEIDMFNFDGELLVKTAHEDFSFSVSTTDWHQNCILCTKDIIAGEMPNHTVWTASVVSSENINSHERATKLIVFGAMKASSFPSSSIKERKSGQRQPQKLLICTPKSVLDIPAFRSVTNDLARSRTVGIGAVLGERGSFQTILITPFEEKSFYVFPLTEQDWIEENPESMQAGSDCPAENLDSQKVEVVERHGRGSVTHRGEILSKCGLKPLVSRTAKCDVVKHLTESVDNFDSSTQVAEAVKIMPDSSLPDHDGSESCYIRALQMISEGSCPNSILTELENWKKNASFENFNDENFKCLMVQPSAKKVMDADISMLNDTILKQHYKMQVFLRLWRYSKIELKNGVKDPIPTRPLKEAKSFLASFTMNATREEFLEFIESDFFAGFKNELTKTIAKLGYPFFEDEENHNDREIKRRSLSVFKTPRKTRTEKVEYSKRQDTSEKKGGEGTKKSIKRAICNAIPHISMFSERQPKRSKLNKKPVDQLTQTEPSPCHPKAVACLSARSKRYSVNHFTTTICENMLSKTLLRHRKLPPNIGANKKMPTFVPKRIPLASSTSAQAATPQTQIASTKSSTGRASMASFCSGVMETPGKRNTVAETPDQRLKFSSPAGDFGKTLFHSPSRQGHPISLQHHILQTPARSKC